MDDAIGQYVTEELIRRGTDFLDLAWIVKDANAHTRNFSR